MQLTIESMTCPEVRSLLVSAIDHRLIQDGKIVGGTIFVRLLDNWIDMNESVASLFLRTLLSIDEQSRHDRLNLERIS